MKRITILILIMSFLLTGCDTFGVDTVDISGFETSSSKEENIELNAILDESINFKSESGEIITTTHHMIYLGNYLYYDSCSLIVYLGNDWCPYYGPNGRLCKYDPETNTISELSTNN